MGTNFQSKHKGSGLDLKVALKASTILAGALMAIGPVTAGAFAQDEPAAEEDVIIVEGRRAAIERASELEREADEFKSIVTADDIGQFGDPTVAESLQRIPGLAITRSNGEGQQVTIRGLPTEFATVTVDGARLGTSDNEANSTDLNFFGADNLSQIEVVKTLTPERDADAIAGSVDLKTISAFSRGRNAFRASAELGYQDKNEAYNPKYSADFTRIVNADNGRWGFAGSITYLERENITDQLEVGDGLNFMLLNDDGGDLEWVQDGDADNCQDGDVVLECYLIPVEFDVRSDLRDRERIALAGQIEWETGNHLFALRGTYSQNEDFRLNTRITYDLSRSDGDLAEGVGTANPDVDEVVDFGVDANGNLFGIFEDGRSERRIRPGDIEREVYTFGFEGTSYFNDNWSANYGFDISENKEDIAISELRTRADNVTQVFSNLGQSGVDITLEQETFDVDASDPDPTQPEAFAIRVANVDGNSVGVGINDRFTDSDDSHEVFYADFERQMELYGREAAFKFGAKHRARERTFDFTRVEYLTDPNVTLADFDPSPLAPHTDFLIPFEPNRGTLQSLLQEQISNGTIATAEQRGNFITRADLENDFTAQEDVTAGYAQLTFNPKDNVQVIAGVRVESTDYTTTGSAFREIGYSDNVTNVLVQALTNGGVSQDDINAFVASRQDNAPITAISGSNDYTDIFPSVNVRWEPTETTVVRLSYSEGIKRPEFREAAAIQQFSTNEEVDDDDLCDIIAGTSGAGCPDSISTFTGSLASVADAQAAIATEGSGFESEGVNFRNPLLDPLISQNWDASWAWYPNERTVLSAAVFYKQIENFIAPIGLAGNDVTRVGLEVDDGTVNSTGVSSVDTFINGDEAEILGLELNYYQAYTFLPAPFNGTFVQANATFTDSEASAEQVDRVFPFPDQADLIGNVSIGWENDSFSIRGAMVYQGERLRILNEASLDDANDPAGDVSEEERTQYDISVRWEPRDGVQLYFDAININDAEDNRFFQGGGTDVLNGSIFHELENYGATYNIGIRTRF